MPAEVTSGAFGSLVSVVEAFDSQRTRLCREQVARLDRVRAVSADELERVGVLEPDGVGHLRVERVEVALVVQAPGPAGGRRLELGRVQAETLGQAGLVGALDGVAKAFDRRQDLVDEVELVVCRESPSAKFGAANFRESAPSLKAESALLKSSGCLARSACAVLAAVPSSPRLNMYGMTLPAFSWMPFAICLNATWTCGWPFASG